MCANEKTNYTCTGYHGTDSQCAQQILKSQQFKKSNDDEEWLGDGAYFFENDKQQAVYYAKKAKKIVDYKVISVAIQSNSLLDLIDTETYESFEQFAYKLKDRYKKRKDKKPRQLMNSVVLDVMYKLKPYEVVRAVFPVPRTSAAPRTNIQQMQVQVCVKEQKCISDIKEVAI